MQGSAVEWRYLRTHGVGTWTDLSAEAARQLTEIIKGTAEHLFTLLYQAHQRKAWKALGYSSWQAYVAVEFDLSRSRAYQLLDQARVVAEITAAASTDVDIPEVAARELKPVLAELVHTIRSQVAGADPADVPGIVERVITNARRYRQWDLRDQRRRRRNERYEERVAAGLEPERRPWRQGAVQPSSVDQHHWTAEDQEDLEDQVEAEAAAELERPWVDDRGLPFADAAVLDAHHSAWNALHVLEGLDLQRVARLLSAAERKDYADRAQAMRSWLDRYQATLRTGGMPVTGILSGTPRPDNSAGE